MRREAHVRFLGGDPPRGGPLPNMMFPLSSQRRDYILNKLIKIGAKVVSHSKTISFQLAEVAVPQKLFAAILDRIERLRASPLAV